MWATLTTNIAANVVAPANAFVNVAPKLISFEVW
jgi:NCS1 family nucleobase:cation symporter-1